jgi:hypothetical protein
LVVPVAQAVLAVLVAQAGLVVLVVSVAPVVLVVLVVPVALVALAASVAGIARQPFRPAARATGGSTIRNIAEAPRTEIGRPQIGSGERRVEIRLPTVRLARGNSFSDRAATWPAIGVARASITGLEEEALATGAEQAPATGRAEAEGIASETGISRAAAGETGMRSAAVPGDTTDRVLAPAATAERPAWDLGAEVEASVGAEAAEVEAVDGAGKRLESWKGNHGSTDMKSTSANKNLAKLLWIIGTFAWACLCSSVLSADLQPASKKAPPATTAAAASAKSFDSPQQAADALVDAAEKFDEVALGQIFGAGGEDIVFSGEYAQDRKHAADFAAEAREKKSVSVDPKSGNRAYILVGNEDWPFPVPLVKKGDKWSFDAKSGRQELLYRRIGANELDAIQVCRGYVEAQYDYAFEKREGYDVNQYAQRIVSTPGKQDGLAWQNPDGTWGGPIGEKIARAIEQGYTSGAEPYHGYFFKILKGQGPAAPLGEMDFVVKGVMIGGFALVAAPTEYGVTGVRTFIVSDDGVVYEKDFGPRTPDEFKKMERFNPDQTWVPVFEDEE